MTRTQIQQLVVVLLLVLFVGVFLLSKKAPEPGGVILPSPAGAGKPTVKPSSPAPVAAPAVSPDLTIPRDVFLLPTLLVKKLQERDTEAKTLKDKKNTPLQPETVSAQQIGITDLELQGIFWGIANPQAIINRQIVSVGDRIKDVEVEAITKNSVILSQNGQKFELKPEIFRSSDDKKEGSGQPWPR